jgi:hypothetical protein
MSKLNDLLTVMYQDACQREKVPQKRKLKNGLHISLTSFRDGPYLAISRDTVYPAMKEWETVLAHFPYFVGKIEPELTTDSERRKCLHAKLPTRIYVAEQMKFTD